MKKILTLAGLAALVALQAAVAWNARLWWRGRAVATGAPEKIRLFRQANAVFPWNGAVHLELGKVYFEQGAESLGDPAARDRLFDQAVASFLESLRLNPASAAAHFELAQALLYKSFLSPSAPPGYFEEYKRAAGLTGHNSEIHYQVGKVLLGNWEGLAPEERDFAVDLLKRTLAGRSEERLPDLLEAWSLSGRDYALIDRILPDDPAALRIFARFLGERSLSLEARQSALARAESLDVLRARADLDRARREAESFRTGEAIARSTAALEALGRVAFYQRLTGVELFDPEEYARTRKAARRLLAMSRIEETRSLADPDGSIAAYLAIEDEFTALSEFETFIKERGLLDEDPAGSPFRDLQTLAFRLALDFQLNRYRDIVRVGDLLASSSFVIAPSGKASYVRVLVLVGESDLKLDSVYEAERHFRKALEVDPDNLDALLGIERCCARLSDETGAAEARLAIGRLTSPAAIDLGGRIVPKGESFEIELITDGRPRTVELGFSSASSSGNPLVSVFHDGRVVWEGNGDTGPAKFSISPRPGRLSLEILAVGDAISLGLLAQAAAPAL